MAVLTYRRRGTLELAVLLAVGLPVHNGYAQDIETVQQAVSAVSKTTAEICGAIEAAGSTKSTKVGGEVKASIGILSRIFKILGLPDIDASVSATIENSNYKGLRQQDVPSVMMAQIGCRERTFAILYRSVPAPEQPTVASSNYIVPPSRPPRLEPAAAPGRPGWHVDERTGCNIWNIGDDPAGIVTWSGNCSGGMASGNGVVQWVAPPVKVTIAGLMLRGRFEGLLTIIGEDSSKPPGQRVSKVTATAHDGEMIKGFTTMWREDGVKASGTFEADGNTSVGPAIMTFTFPWRGYEIQARYEGTIVNQSPDNGWETLEAPGMRTIVRQVIHGCRDDPPGRCPR